MQLPISAIAIGERVRKDMGDIDGLAESIGRHGLLHPVVVDKDNTLVAGHRRIEAVKRLGWQEIPVTKLDVEDLLNAERDENTERKDFTPSEAVAIGRLIEERHKAKIEAVYHAQRVAAGKSSAAARHGNGAVIQPPVKPQALGPVREPGLRQVQRHHRSSRDGEEAVQILGGRIWSARRCARSHGIQARNAISMRRRACGRDVQPRAPRWEAGPSVKREDRPLEQLPESWRWVEYESRKTWWLMNNPTPSPSEYEQAMQRIAQEIGV